MTAEAAAIVRTFRVGRYTVTATLRRPRPGVVAHSSFEWEPGLPERLTKRELRAYRAARDALFAELVAMTGTKMVVFDI